MSDPIDLGGPLPVVDRFNQNQQRSIRKLNESLPVDRIRFRDERIDDFGVDGSLEVHASGQATNLRSVVQLKSMEHAELNEDGSVSFSAEVTNLVYLLNGPSPLYVLYVVDTDTLLYVWVRDEVRRIELSKPEWKTQGSVTLRFSSVLDAGACDDICARVLREGVLTRQIFALLSKAAQDRLHIAISPETLDVYDHDAVLKLLTETGVAITSAGFPHIVVEKAALLTQNEREQPLIALALGYAEYSRGRYAAGDGHLVFARLGESSLDSSRRQLLGLLSNASDVELGRITQEAYLENEATLVGSDSSPVRRQHESRVLWDGYLRDRHPDQGGALVSKLRAIVGESEQDQRESPESRLQLELALLTAETDLAIAELLTLNAQNQIADRIELPWFPKVDHHRAWSIRWESLVERHRRAVLASAQLLHPILMGMSSALAALAEFQLYLVTRLMSIPLGQAVPDHSAKIYELMATIDAARKQMASVGQIDEEIRLTLNIAEMYMALGNDLAARKLAADALIRARALRYDRLAVQADSLARGDWYVHRFERQLEELRAKDDDVLAAAESDETLGAMARSAMHMFDLPVDRLPAIRREHETLRMFAQERLAFCRHLHIIQNLEHTRSRDTFYAEIPPQACRCALYGYESPVTSRDASELLADFKLRYCANCTSKSPKR